jgi:hypothetical protein
MQDSKDKKTGDLLQSSGAKRQAAFRARQKAEGKKQVLVWIDSISWNLGFEAGKCGSPNTPPKDADELSFFSGYIEGKAKREGF